MLKDYTRYLKDYADHFDVTKHIEFHCRVTNIRSRTDGEQGYTVTWTRTTSGAKDETDTSTSSSISSEHFTLDCFAVAVCSGLHVIPNIPSFPGLENLSKNKIEMLHSSSYKNSACLKDKNVLICGLGETSSDIGYDAIHAPAKKVVVSHRHGFLSFPKRFNDFVIFGYRFDAELPIDTLISNLHESAYVHPYLKAKRFRWFFSDVWVRSLLTVLTGSNIGCNQFAAPAERIGRAYNFLNKSTKSMPYINAGFNTNYWWKPLFHVIEPDTKGKIIHLRPAIERIDDEGCVHFIDNGTPEAQQAKESGPFKPDIVVFATGYSQDSSFLDASLPRANDCDIRDIINESHPRLAYIGHVRPNVGAIPPLAEMQAMWWLQVLVGNLKPEDCREKHGHWKLLELEHRRLKYAIDHSSYVYQLAKDIKATPSVYPPSPIFYKQPKLLLIYAMGASFNTFFRLVGPYAFPEAGEIMRGELWETVTRRGVLGNVVMGLVPMFFYGTVNAVVWSVDKVLSVFGLGF